MISVLDRGGTPENVVRVVPLRQADPAALKQAIEVYRGALEGRSPDGSSTPAPLNRTPANSAPGGLKDELAPSGSDSGEKGENSSGVKLSAMFPDEQAQTGDAQSTPPAAPSPPAQNPAAQNPAGTEPNELTPNETRAGCDSLGVTSRSKAWTTWIP